VNLRTTYWSDSTITLAWIKGNKERRTFVKNRVNDIKKKTDPDEWFHCPGEENPADLVSRGMTAEEFVSSDLFRFGSEWLRQPKDTWPGNWEEPSEEILDKAELEAEKKNKVPSRKKVTVCAAAVIGQTGPPPPTVTSSVFISELVPKFSRFYKLCRVTAFVFRYFTNIRKRIQKRKKKKEEGNEEEEQPPSAYQEVAVSGKMIKIPCLTTTEIERARFFWIAQIQRDAHPAEYHNLSKGLAVSSLSDIADLCPIWDPAGGVIRVTGRIQPALGDDDYQPPILLPLSVEKKGAKGKQKGAVGESSSTSSSVKLINGYIISD